MFVPHVLDSRKGIVETLESVPFPRAAIVKYKLHLPTVELLSQIKFVTQWVFMRDRTSLGRKNRKH